MSTARVGNMPPLRRHASSPPPIPPRYVPGLSGMVVLRPSQCFCAAGNWRSCFRAALSCSLGATVAQIYDRGDIRPKRTLTFNIQVSDDGETHGPPFRERRTFRNWRHIGTITFDRAVVSYNGDFRHPFPSSDVARRPKRSRNGRTRQRTKGALTSRDLVTFGERSSS